MLYYWAPKDEVQVYTVEFAYSQLPYYYHKPLRLLALCGLRTLRVRWE